MVLLPFLLDELNVLSLPVQVWIKGEKVRPNCLLCPCKLAPGGGSRIQRDNGISVMTNMLVGKLSLPPSVLFPFLT